MWEEMWENISENPLFIYKIQHLMRWFGTSPATTFLSNDVPRNPWKTLDFCSILLPTRPPTTIAIPPPMMPNLGKVNGVTSIFPPAGMRGGRLLCTPTRLKHWAA